MFSGRFRRMKQVKKTFVGFLIGIGIYAVLAEIAGIILSQDILTFTLGLVFGVIVAILLFLHMADTLDKALDLPKKRAGNYIRLQSFFRLALMLLALVIGMLVDKLNFVAVVIGLLGLKIGALSTPFFLKKLYPEDFVTEDK